MTALSIGLGIPQTALLGASSGPTPAGLLEQLQAGLSGSAKSGIWNPADLSTLYSDSARTTLATANGPVGSASDVSGNNNHWAQATADNRPLATDGLTFDGTNDDIRMPFPGGAGSANMDLLIGVITTDTQFFLASNSSGATGATNFFLAAISGSSSTALGNPAPWIDDVQFVDGVNTLGQVSTAIADNAWHRAEGRGGNYSGWTGITFANSAGVANRLMSGKIFAAVLIDRTDFTETEANNLRTIAQDWIDEVGSFFL